jgi:hypothetical protein
MSVDTPLSRDDLLNLLQEVSDYLATNGQTAQLFIVGGAAMALAYDSGRSTTDIDGAFIPSAVMRMVAEQVGADHGLDPDWLNDAAKGFLPGDDDDPRVVFESESLLVQVASPKYLLAMKLHSARQGRDFDDAVKLFRMLGYSSADQAFELLESKYPSKMLQARHEYFSAEVAQAAMQTKE